MTSTLSVTPFQQSGAVQLDGGFYIRRKADDEYVARLADFGSGPVHLHGSRQSGKSSLLIRACEELRRDHDVGYVDLGASFAAGAVDAGAFGQRVVAAVAREFDESRGQWHEAAGRDGMTEALIDLCLSRQRPVILLFDELDSIPNEYRRELSRAVRAILQRRAREPGLIVNYSLCGVEPPLGFFNGAAQREGLEPVGGTQIWLDDLECSDAEAERVHERFEQVAGDLAPSAAQCRRILEHAGGYPQAFSWLGNLLIERLLRTGGQRFHLAPEGRLAEQLRQITSDYFDPASTFLREATNETAWVRTNESFFAEHGRAARDAMSIYESVLNAYVKGLQYPVYLNGDRRHELLRTSGLARLEGTELRLRCPLFANAFDQTWVERMRRQLLGAQPYGRKTGTRIDKRLLIIGTGGTIGMAEDKAGKVAPPSEQASWFRAVEELVANVELDPLCDLDSANMGPEQWSMIARAIVRRQDDFDGVLVAHGTDTLAYSASAVAFALGRRLSFPVVFTGSQTTVDITHGDALANMLRSALVATKDLPEVVVCFGEKIFRATRTQKKDDRRFDAFESPGYPELGFVAEEAQVFEQMLLSKPDRGPLTTVSAEFAAGILLVSQMPGSEAAFYESALDARDSEGRPMCRGVIIQSLGAGNVPTKGPAFDLTRLIREANRREIPVVLTSQYPVLPANYLRFSPSAAAIEAGAIPTGNMTISAVVAKLSWVIPQVDAQIRSGLLRSEQRIVRVRDMMSQEIVGEGGLSLVETTDESETSL